MKEIKEENEEEEQIDDKIWGLDEDDAEGDRPQQQEISDGDDEMDREEPSEFMDDRE